MNTAVWVLCRRLWHLQTIPSKWAMGVIVPLPKNIADFDRTNPLHYRPITLLSALGKVFATVINERLKVWIEERSLEEDAPVGLEQFGFRVKRSAVDAAYTLAET